MKQKNKLKITRLQKNLTQKQLADESKVSERRYRDYEAGKRLPNVLTAIRIAEVLDSDVKTLFSITEYHEKGQAVKNEIV